MSDPIKPITKQDFIAKIRTKYPSYSNINDDELYTKILEKYPEYSSNIVEDVPVKKKDDTVVPSGASDSQLVQPSTPSDSTSQEVSVDPVKPIPSKQVAQQKEEIAWYTDLSTRFKRGGLTALAGVAGIPNFINKLTASIVLDEESLREINSLPPAAREAVLATGNPAQMSLIANSAEAQNFLTEKADKLAGKTIEYEGNIIDDFGNGNIGQGVYRALQGVVESAPSMIMAMAPGGLAVIGAGTGAQKQEEQEKEGGKVNLASTVNSVINGGAEYYFERYTQQRLEPIKKMVVGEMAAAKEVAENMVGTLVKDIWGEAQSEAWTTVVQDLSDKLVAGKDISLIQIAKNVVDAGIIGGAMGGGIGGTNVAAAKTMQAYTATKTMSTEKKKAIVEAKEVSESLKKELNLTDSKNVQDILKSKIEEVDQKVAEAKQAEIDKIENLSDEQVKQVFEIDQQMKEINDEYKAVVKNTEMSPDAKDIVEKELNVKFKELEAQKEKVLTTSTPTVATTEAPTSTPQAVTEKGDEVENTANVLNGVDDKLLAPVKNLFGNYFNIVELFKDFKDASSFNIKRTAKINLDESKADYGENQVINNISTLLTDAGIKIELTPKSEMTDGNYASYDGEKIKVTDAEIPLPILLHEIGEKVLSDLDKSKTKVEHSTNIFEAVTTYGASRGNDAFSDNFYLYFLSPQTLKDLSPNVYKELSDLIPKNIQELGKGLMLKYGAKEQTLVYNKDNSFISEAYHKAKKDGSNPELVKEVEKLLSETTPKNEISEKNTIFANKPKLEMTFPPNIKMRKAANFEASMSKLETIKTKYKELQSIIDCLHG